MSFFNFGKKSKIGIDIGTASVKIVQLAKESGRFKLENYGLFELEAIESALSMPGQTGINPANYQLDQHLAWGIKETLRRSKITAKDVVASIPSFNTFSTVIKMPYLSEQDIAKTIPYEARKYIPIPLDQVVLDWSIIDVAPAGAGQILARPPVVDKPPTVDVYLVAVPRDETSRYQNIMKQAGLNLKALELENSALIRALVGNDQSSIAIINIGGRSTSILIVEKGFERVSHNYEVGGFEISKAIARALNVSLKRAEELKRGGSRGDNSEMIAGAMSSLVDLIVFETQKTIHNYEDLKKTKIAKVILIGGLANMPKFVEYFSGKLGFPVSLGNPLARIVYPPTLEKLKTELNSTFAIALGLAMREVS